MYSIRVLLISREGSEILVSRSESRRIPFLVETSCNLIVGEFDSYFREGTRMFPEPSLTVDRTAIVLYNSLFDETNN